MISQSGLRGVGASTLQTICFIQVRKPAPLASLELKQYSANFIQKQYRPKRDIKKKTARMELKIPPTKARASSNLRKERLQTVLLTLFQILRMVALEVDRSMTCCRMIQFDYRLDVVLSFSLGRTEVSVIRTQLSNLLEYSQQDQYFRRKESALMQQVDGFMGSEGFMKEFRVQSQYCPQSTLSLEVRQLKLNWIRLKIELNSQSPPIYQVLFRGRHCQFPNPQEEDFCSIPGITEKCCAVQVYKVMGSQVTIEALLARLPFLVMQYAEEEAVLTTCGSWQQPRATMQGKFVALV